MIQRIQSVWLFFATACIFSLFLFPYLQVLNSDGSASLIKVTGVYQSIAGQQVQTEAFLTLTIATVILALIPFAIIFMFKDRKKQIMLSYIAIVLVIGFSFWLIQTAKGVIGSVELQAENYGVGSLIPSISILFLILAIRGMKKDDRLIKSADRLR
jgi:MFS superfamily sulfate permease-like transporter